MGPHPAGDLVVADQRAVRSVPGADQAAFHSGLVHRGERAVQRNFPIRQLAGPPAQRLEHLLLEQGLGWVLHPHVDDRHAAILVSWAGKVCNCAGSLLSSTAQPVYAAAMIPASHVLAFALLSFALDIVPEPNALFITSPSPHLD